MFENDNPKHRLIEALMGRAAEDPWREISLQDIASAAGMSLADARSHFSSRTDIMKAFVALVDAEVLARAAEEGDPDDPARDRLFDTLMTRFEVLAPFKPTLRMLRAGARRGDGPGLDLGRALLEGQRWMLEAAGIQTTGVSGSARVLATSAIYAQAFDTWLDDDDAGMAKTMAALDARLRRGEKAAERFKDVVSLFGGFAKAAFGGRRRGRGRDGATPEDDTQSPSDRPGDPAAAPL
ncbi:MAG: TetR/AcrR family transcriptional regulator [Pseudomonadota bacterium]